MKNNKKALLIIAHGSRKKVSNIEIHQLASKISKESSRFNFVKACFLEIAEPLIPDGILNCINEGASEILVFPYFLAAGRHVIEDIPGIIVDEQKKYPDIKIKSLPYFGSDPVIVDIVKTLAENDA